MNKQNIYFIVLISILGLLSMAVLYKFITVIVIAYIFSVLIKPVYLKINNLLSKVVLLNKKSSSIASLITIILFILLIITPVSIILGKIVVDTQSVYNNIVSNDINLSSIGNNIKIFSDKFYSNVDFDLNFSKIIESAASFLANNVGGIFSGTFDVVLKIFLFLLTMFYFLRDGKQFGELYKSLSPLKKETDDKIFESIKKSISSIMLGSLTVAVAQGVFTGIGFWIFGVPNPFFFGTIAGFLALIPALGPALVWIPAAIYLYFTKDGSFVWLYQVLWGVFAVGLIDNFLGPLVINKGIKIHQLLILFSIIGGLSVFGPEGFILGPLILSIFISILKTWNESKHLE